MTPCFGAPRPRRNWVTGWIPHGVVALVEAEPGYRGDRHAHDYPEFLYVVDGKLRNQGREMVRGDGYAAAPGSTHADFETESGATYISIFKI